MEARGFESRWARVGLVTDQELSNPLLVCDAKSFLAKIDLPRRHTVDFLVDGVRDAEAILVDEAGQEVEFDFEEIERDNIDLWFRDWVKRPVRVDQLRIREEARERIRLVVTMLRLIFPKESSVWGGDIGW